MAVLIKGVEHGSFAEKVGLKQGEILCELNGNEIIDVLDYRFYQNETVLKVKVQSADGIFREVTVKKPEYDELGLEFETYLMDKQHSCKNKCIFCFIDQLPKGLRESLYFKDDDSRMSFLFGNYITLTNLTEHEIERIIKLHISPVNVSVHTTDPELRCKMMGNRFAGKSLDTLWRFCEAGIDVNCQLVLVPGYNDGEALEKSLNDLIKYPSIKSIASVPVGLTGHREGLCQLEPFNKETASRVIDITTRIADKTVDMYGERRVFAADEFYLIAKRELPDSTFYGDFLQLENGVGMWAMLKDECDEAIDDFEPPISHRKITLVTGEAAYSLLSNIVDKVMKKWHNLECEVIPIKNNFFGGKITVTGLITGQDIIEQLKEKDLGEELLISSSMLRHEGDMFLDSMTVQEVEEALNVNLRVVDSDGWALMSALCGE